MSQDSQNYNKEDRRPPRMPNRPGTGGDDPQGPKKGPRFSIYWIYAIIFAVLIGFQLFSPFSRNMSKINELDFKNMIAAGDVARYQIIDNRKKVKVYLTKSGMDKYADKLKKGVTGKIAEEGPHMVFTITSGDTFKKGIDDFYKENPRQCAYAAIARCRITSSAVRNLSISVLLL